MTTSILTPNITADGTYTIVTTRRPRYGLEYDALVQIGGTFGGGTLAAFISLDGGTTKNPMLYNGSAYTATAPATWRTNFPADGTVGHYPIIYFTMTGSTTPNVSVIVVDNT